MIDLRFPNSPLLPGKIVARDLIHAMSPPALKSKLDPLVASNPQPLPIDAKRFLAVAKIQGFDRPPERMDTPQIEALIASGCIELNRGLRPVSGLPARFFADQFYNGAMYPGTQIVYGHGMYFAEPGADVNPPDLNFPRMSEVAVRYATRGGVIGVVLRGVLKREAKTMEIDALRDEFRAEKNRLRRMGIEDLGTFAAALGIDAYAVDEAFDYSKERTWIVVNRSVLVLQSVGKQLAEKEGLTSQ